MSAVRLGDVARIVSGVGFPLAEQGSEGQIAFLKVSDLNAAGFDGLVRRSANYVTAAAIKRLGARICPAGTTVFPKVGGALLTNKRRLLAIEAAFDNNVMGAIPRRVDPNYLYLWLRSVDLAALANTQTLPSIRQSDVADLAVPLPALDEQRRVAAHLTAQLATVAAAARLADEERRATEGLRVRTYADVFRNIVPLCVRENDGADPPPGWRWRLLTDLARLETGHTPSRNHPEWWGGEVGWIQLADIRAVDGQVIDVTLETTNPDGIAHSAARVLPADSVVMSRTASVGFVARMARPMATSQDFVNWVCGPGLDPQFLLHMLIRSREYVRSLSSGAIHKTVYYPTVKAFRICAPDINEQRRIVDALTGQLSSIDGAIAAGEAMAGALTAMPAAILREAFASLA